MKIVILRGAGGEQGITALGTGDGRAVPLPEAPIEPEVVSGSAGRDLSRWGAGPAFDGRETGL